jgi:RimJ/RimL family protein N-acetyltransferase
MIITPRLILRQWRDSDLDPWAALNADPEVMRHFPAVHTRLESDAMAAGNRDYIDQYGFGLWAVECASDGQFLGFVGLKRLSGINPLAPAVEAGWRLSRQAWGQGYATEAAAAAMADGFERLGLERIVAFTASQNLPSQAVMTRLGMTRREDLDFDHPALPAGHRLSRHLVWEALRP